MHKPVASSDGYHSFTLRLSRGVDTHMWRVILFCAQTGKRHYFRDLEELHAFLLEVTTDSERVTPQPLDAIDQPISAGATE